MARKTTTTTDEVAGAAFDAVAARIIDTTLQDEVAQSYLEYAYSVISSRALPDARDGLKPVHRRILFSMSESGLRPDHAFVKSARVVGDVLGRYHPHGDSSVYDALVRMAQPFSLNLPLVAGHGNFGSPNGDSAAAMRYTECRLSHGAMRLVSGLDEECVDTSPTYDGSAFEPVVMPAQFPNLLVNGSSGIAVGMATNMIPHNLGEAVTASRALIANPSITLDELMKIMPGPDLPTGGLLLGADQVRLAYETGKGTVRLRAKVSVEDVPAGRNRKQLVVTEMPYQVGTEKIIDSVKQEISKQRLSGVADVKDLSDRKQGTRLVIECKTGVNPQALLADLYKYTPLEVSFGISNLALVNGVPKTMGLKEILEVFVAFRFDVVTRRTQYRLRKANDRLHLVDGLLIALDNIDKVVKVIRASSDTSAARAALQQAFSLSDIQASYILETPLRRLVNLEVTTLRNEKAELNKTIAALAKILKSDKELRRVVDTELEDILTTLPSPRKTSLVDGNLADVLEASAPAAPLEVPDEPVTAYLSATGLIGRSPSKSEETAESTSRKRGRGKHDIIVSSCSTTTRGNIILVTSLGRAFRIPTLSIVSLDTRPGVVSLAGASSVSQLVSLTANEEVVVIASDVPDAHPIILGTRNGIVKACASDWPTRSDDFPIMNLNDGDVIIGGAQLDSTDSEFVFVSTDASLLRFPADKVRAQGRTGGGVAGVRLGAGQHAVGFYVVTAEDAKNSHVITWTSTSSKRSLFSEFPAKGRATGGVRSQRFSKDESALSGAYVGIDPGGCTTSGAQMTISEPVLKRDAAGLPGDEPQTVGRVFSV